MKKKYTKYHNDGSLWAQGFMDGKFMVGKWIWFRKAGSKMRAGQFLKSKQVGDWTTYDKLGKIVKVTHFKK